MMRQEKKTGQKNKGKERPGKSNGSPEIPPQEMDIRHPQPPFGGLVHEQNMFLTNTSKKVMRSRLTTSMAMTSEVMANARS